MYDEKYRRSQYFFCPEWSGGVYASPGMTGSRAGALLAACWATLMSIGKAGYVGAARRIINGASPASSRSVSAALQCAPVPPGFYAAHLAQQLVR